MTFWVLNFWMYWMFLTNPGVYQQLVAQGNSMYVCMELTPAGMVPSNACTEPMPSLGK